MPGLQVPHAHHAAERRAQLGLVQRPLCVVLLRLGGLQRGLCSGQLGLHGGPFTGARGARLVGLAYPFGAQGQLACLRLGTGHLARCRGPLGAQRLLVQLGQHLTALHRVTGLDQHALHPAAHGKRQFGPLCGANLAHQLEAVGTRIAHRYHQGGADCFGLGGRRGRAATGRKNTRSQCPVQGLARQGDNE